MKDNIFESHSGSEFKFDESVATVFDDMISRSVPYYKNSLELSVDFILKNVKDGDKIIDLGCSTATTLLSIYQKTDLNLQLIGIDNSSFMIKQAKRKIDAFNANIEVIESDILNTNLSGSSVVISNYTLQFIPPNQRAKLIKKIYNSLEDNSLFIFSEKVISKDKKLNFDMVDIYYKYKKRQGYSEVEIVKKKEALENILIPLSEEENKQMLKDAGFEVIEVLFKWVNFTTFIALKRDINIDTI